MPAASQQALAAPSAAANQNVSRPKQGQCVRCDLRAGCTRVDFKAMPVLVVHADGTRIVDCLDFQSRRGKMH